MRLLAFFRFDSADLSAHGEEVTMFASVHAMPSISGAAAAVLPIAMAYVLQVLEVQESPDG